MTPDQQAQTTSQPVPATGGEIRTYRGSSVEELVPRIRAELGPGAVIVRERQGITGGIGGFFAKRCVEIDAQAPARFSVYAGDLEADDDEEERELDDAAFEAASRPFGGLAGLPEAQAFAAGPAAPAPELPAAPAPEPVVTPEPEVVAEVVEAQAEVVEAQAEVVEPEPAAPEAGPQPAGAWEFIAFDEMSEAAPAPAPTEGWSASSTDAVDQSSHPPVSEPEPVPAVPTPEPPAPVEIHMPLDVAAPAEPRSAAPATEPQRPQASPFRMVPEPEPEPAPEPTAAATPEAAATTAPEPTTAPAPATAPDPAATELLHRLRDRGLSDAFAERLLRDAEAVVAAGGQRETAVLAGLLSALPEPGELPRRGAVAVIGAGGSGKTRAVAALAAARARAGDSVTVAHLGTDERSHELDELLRGRGVEVVPAMRTAAIVEAVDAARRHSLVLIDTTSVAPSDPSGVEVLAETLGAFALDEVLLTAPATYSGRVLASAVNGFAPLRPTGLIATHVDEAEGLGAVTELSIAHGVGLGFAHAGVDVTTAITQLDAARLARELVR